MRIHTLQALSVARNKGVIVMPKGEYQALRQELVSRREFNKAVKGWARMGHTFELCTGTEHRNGGVYKLTRGRAIIDKGASLGYFISLLSERILRHV